MADVRSMLKQQRAARRIQHRHATYTSSGVLACTICNLQIKSETLWEGHLRSAGHAMRLSRLQDAAAARAQAAAEAEATTDAPIVEDTTAEDPAESSAVVGAGSKKRKAKYDDEEEEEDALKSKRSRPNLEGLDQASATDDGTASPMKVDAPEAGSSAESKTPEQGMGGVDEDEWAAFEADIAAIAVPAAEAVISAPALTAAEVQARTVEETYAERKARQEATLAEDKEEATRSLELELEEMEGLEARVRKLREKREAIRLAKPAGNGKGVQSAALPNRSQRVQGGVDGGHAVEEVQEDDSDSTDDDWDDFRIKR